MGAMISMVVTMMAIAVAAVVGKVVIC